MRVLEGGGERGKEQPHRLQRVGKRAAKHKERLQNFAMKRTSVREMCAKKPFFLVKTVVTRHCCTLFFALTEEVGNAFSEYD